MSHDIDIGMKKHLKIQENVFLVTIGTPGHNIHKMAQVNFAKISKKSIFSIFPILSRSGRKCDIWPEIDLWSPGECPETIEDVYIVIRADFAKIEKNRFLKF